MPIKKKEIVSKELDVIRSTNPAEMYVLIPALVIEYGAGINDLYMKGVRNFFVYSIDQAFEIDFSNKLKAKSPDINITYFDLWGRTKLPKFTFALAVPEGILIDDLMTEYLKEKKIPVLKFNDVFGKVRR